MKPWRRLSVICVSIVVLLAVHVFARAQSPSAQAGLTAAISQTRSGDFFKALLTLNDVIIQLSDKPGESATLARVHAYKALAYMGLDQPERAKASALEALKADPQIRIDAGEFGPKVVALFGGARRPAAEDPEATGQTAEQAGRSQEAFLAYLNAFQSLPEPPARTDDQRLREKIIGVVQKLDTKPVIPPEAREHLKKANDLLDAAAILGNSGTTAAEQRAALELRQAVRSAPWWPDATFQLATVLQKLQRFDEALLNLNLYKLADPVGYAATVDRVNPKSAVASASTERESKPIAPAVIYVYYPHAVRSMGIKPKVLCDGQHVADLENGRFIVLNVPPGFHRVDFRDQNVSSSFESGRDHYLRGGIEGYPAHLALRLTNPDKAAAEMKQVSPNDPKRTFSTECKAVAAIPK